MPDDYAAAAVRHFVDGRLLEANSRIANADHLFGLAAECAIKSVLANFSSFLHGGVLASAYRKHVDELWMLVPLQGIQRRYGALVTVLRALHGPFADWSTAQRYAADGVVTAEAIERHREAAKRVLGSVGLIGARAAG